MPAGDQRVRRFWRERHAPSHPSSRTVRSACRTAGGLAASSALSSRRRRPCSPRRRQTDDEGREAACQGLPGPRRAETRGPSRNTGALTRRGAGSLISDHAPVHRCQARGPDPDLPRGDHRRLRADPADPGRSDRAPCRRAWHHTRAPCRAHGPARARQAALATIRGLPRRSRAGRPRPLDQLARASAVRVPDPVPGDRRALGLRAHARRADRPAGRDHRWRPPRLGLRPDADGRLADRLLDADLLVGPARDHPVLQHSCTGRRSPGGSTCCTTSRRSPASC